MRKKWMFYIHIKFLKTLHYVKSVSIWSISGSYFSRIWTEYGEVRDISPHSVQMRENKDQKNSDYGHFSRSVFQRPAQENKEHQSWKI